jgi:hypothetical protein
MPDPVVPDYVSDPPIDRGVHHSDDTARRWLTDLGLEGRGTDWVGNFKLPELIRRLSAALGTSDARIEAILEEAAFQYLLKHTLFEWFDPVPHETDVRQKLVHLARKTHDLPKRPGYGRLWIYPTHPDHVDDSIAFLRRAYPESDGLIEAIHRSNCARAWERSLTATTAQVGTSAENACSMTGLRAESVTQCPSPIVGAL